MIRTALADRRGQRVIAVAIVVLLALGVVVSRLPRPVDGLGTLDECLGGWPVVKLEGAWQDALPENVRQYPPGYLPVAIWPTGMTYDQATGELRESNGAVLFRRGDRVRVRGTVIEVHGDPSPCFYIYNLKVDRIATE